MTRLLCMAALLAGAAVLPGCGQTGQLYFDEDPPADQLPPSRRSSPTTVVPVPVTTGQTVMHTQDAPPGEPLPKTTNEKE